jgi:hypothetical protein
MDQALQFYRIIIPHTESSWDLFISGRAPFAYRTGFCVNYGAVRRRRVARTGGAVRGFSSSFIFTVLYKPQYINTLLQLYRCVMVPYYILLCNESISYTTISYLS